MLEVEAKLRVADLQAMRARLLGLGAVHHGDAVQRDTFLAHPGRDFRMRDEALRVREQDGAWELTFKGPRHGGPGAKSRLEENVRCADDPLPLLLQLGYVPAATVRKVRSSFAFGDVVLALDDVDGVGGFLEVEAIAVDRADGERRVAAALQRLGLEGSELEKRAYVEMV